MSEARRRRSAWVWLAILGLLLRALLPVGIAAAGPLTAHAAAGGICGTPPDGGHPPKAMPVGHCALCPVATPALPSAPPAGPVTPAGAGADNTPRHPDAGLSRPAAYAAAQPRGPPPAT